MKTKLEIELTEAFKTVARTYKDNIVVLNEDNGVPQMLAKIAIDVFKRDNDIHEAP